jgi:hypothetical protein
MVARGVEIDTGDVASPLVRLYVYDNLNGHHQQPLDCVEFEAGTFGGRLHHQGKLVPGLLDASGVATGDGTWVSRGAISDEVKRLVAAKLGKNDAIRLHSKAGFHAAFSGDVACALTALGIEQMNDVGLLDEQFAGILDGHKSLTAGDVMDKRLHEGRLATSGCPSHYDIFSTDYGLPEKSRVIALCFQPEQFAILSADCVVIFEYLIEEAVCLVLGQGSGLFGRQADRDRYTPCLAGRRYDKLGTLAGGESEGHNGVNIGDTLPRVALVDYSSAEVARPLES